MRYAAASIFTVGVLAFGCGAEGGASEQDEWSSSELEQGIGESTCFAAATTADKSVDIISGIVQILSKSAGYSHAKCTKAMILEGKISSQLTSLFSPDVTFNDNPP